tara:strand:- start:838 stop:1608 length:771 start_codon:yes stop_codon:yes gene_type:complete
MENINYIEKTENKTAIIEINRPKQLNALNIGIINEIEKKLNSLQTNNSIRSVIITGAGDKAFVAGADIKEFQGFSAKDANRLSQQGKKKLFNKVAHFNKPVIAAINGYALGGGLELALSCHIRLMSKTARLGLPECSLGLIPGYSGTQRLPRIIGKNLAMEMILTSKMIDAEEAYRIGLVNDVLDPDSLMLKSLDLANKFNRVSPEAVTSAIKSINACYLENGEQIETQEFSQLFETNNFKEGVDAFLNKRKPNFN